MSDTTPEPVILDGVDDLVYRACAVLAGTQLDLFTPLKDGPLSASQIAEYIGVEMNKLRPLLHALVIVGLLTVEDGYFANTDEADYYLVRGHPSYQGNRHKYWSDVWSAALLIAESIRTGKPQKKHDYAVMSEGELEEFLAGLYPWSFDSGTWLAQNYDFSSCQTVLDAGGGSGALVIALTEAWSHLQAMVIELPAVVPITQRFVERAGATARVQVKGVDLVRQSLAGSFDAAILKAVIQTMSLEEAYRVLLNINPALKPGATVYIWDRPLDDSRLTPQDLALFNVVFPSIYEHGQKYTVREYRDLLTETGFENCELHTVADSNRIIIARKAK
ncbi:MAG: methyltransferase domain-containing protein [candidate division Zixibacteria bacterium]|nr:methyltransferase domain-containing protein [Gammaproteobacteria bacterium]NIX56393.1 methyltransferase domain-containing protein [candidate division Zixibacteria bacterium]